MWKCISKETLIMSQIAISPFDCKFHWNLYFMSQNNNIGYLGRPFIRDLYDGLIFVEQSCSKKFKCHHLKLFKMPLQMPEDFLVHGYVWSQAYFPSDFFRNTMAPDKFLSIEEPSMRLSRVYRCLWLAREIFKVSFTSFYAKEITTDRLIVL